MLRPNSYFNELRMIRAKQMRIFNEMLEIVRKRYGSCYPMILADYVNISLNRAEGLDFSNVQFEAMKSLVNTNPIIVSHGYAA